ncbi:MAG: hypothetical protein HBSAPP02_28190 [Phycisphaerae bacterium]|nr:MAG: hypothetical protein HBSAPP02_28190 [Phycisphaerae bacterium]
MNGRSLIMFNVPKIMTVAAAGAVMIGAGCAYRHGDLARSGTLRIELVPPTGPVFYGVFIEQQGGEFVVTGYGKRPNGRGVVEVQVVRPDGEVLGRRMATLLPPLAVPKRTYNYRFRAVLPLVPPDGSVVRVLYSEPGPGWGHARADNRRRRESEKLLTGNGVPDVLR